MKRRYLNPTIEVHKVSCENLLDRFSQDTHTAPEAPDGTEANAKEYDFDFWEDDHYNEQ
ncbi:hypothetical protein J4866_06415 [Prevotella denticola]|uniref:hypothetical protein n=1 Tax=Prevotella denticola TaxID=28129 RepID=UPI001BA45A62|nr:hypothetical protein [Prevotella denticola]QUB92578.1 hypothetical protein J4866_06415 [Prevotella denticola]